MQPITLYLAGPMTGAPLFNFPAFAEARAALRAEGHTVVCPAEEDLSKGFDPAVGDMPDGLALDESFRFDLRAVIDCGAVALLPGWKFSKGVAVELAVAWYTGAEVYEIDSRAPGLLRRIDLPRPAISFPS